MAAGVDKRLAEELVRAASAQDTKDRLKAVSDEALERGVWKAASRHVIIDLLLLCSVNSD
eukprot:m.198907 g.198907  ORF g.198907 m.198907 type:complete len:60 (-) comp14927_c0_seq15:541-720(-)